MSDRQDKREQFQEKNPSRKSWLIPAILVAAVVAAAAGWFAISPSATGHQSVQAAANGTLHFPVAELADGKARFYRFEGRNAEIDFFLVRSKDGVIRAAFDTCDVCYRDRKGYRQEGDHMVCNNCDQRFRTDLVNVVKGGCNPAPLLRKQLGEQIIITAADLERGTGYFRTAVN